MKIKFKKGQKVVCTHYKKKYICVIDCVEGDNLWVTDSRKFGSWWGPKSWFKRIKRGK